MKKQELYDLTLIDIETKLQDNLESLQNLRFQKALQQLEDPIRIKLTPDNEISSHIITSDTTFSLYGDGELLKDFAGSSRVRVTPNDEGFLITSGFYSWTVEATVQFVPIDGGIMQALTMQQLAWDGETNDNYFRGALEIIYEGGTMILINELPLEDYMLGIAEESNSEPTEKIKTIITLARSYAVYYMTEDVKFPGAAYDLEDAPSTSQKYLGYGFEMRAPNINQAVEDTAGLVVYYKDEVIKTPYFSQSDGVATKSAYEVWGWTTTPYLVSVDDSQCTDTDGTFSGHGVGLSACGAHALAEDGLSFEEIIEYYYEGAVVGSI